MPSLASPLARLPLFLGLAAAALASSGLVVGMLGISGPSAAPWHGALFAGGLLVATFVCTRRGESLADAGLRTTPRDALGLLAAFVVGASLFAGVQLALGFAVGGEWNPTPLAPLRVALAGLLPALLLMLSEELLFRGYALQQLRKLCGTRLAVLVSALAFGAYHLLGSGDWAMGAAFRFGVAALGGLLFGYALVRTGSLAVPIGLHWGGNWAQSTLLGLGRMPGEGTVWAMPLDAAQIRELVAPDLLPHLPYLASIALAFVFLHHFGGRHLAAQPRP